MPYDMPRCKITVLKRTINQDLIDEYLDDTCEDIGPCDRFQDGQEFVIDPSVVPEDFFAPFLGGGILAMVVMMALGIPVYVCATASVPVAVALLAKGVSPGAVMVFLMTGPATNAAALATIWANLGRRTAITYIATVAACSIAAGLLRVGASVGTMVAFLTAWSLLAVSRLPLDIAIMGWQFTLIRLACTFFFPPIAGLIANALFPNVNLT